MLEILCRPDIHLLQAISIASRNDNTIADNPVLRYYPILCGLTKELITDLKTDIPV